MTSQKYINIHVTWESPTRLWMFKVLIKAAETRNFLNAYFVVISTWLT